MGSKIQVTAGNVKIGGGAKVSVQSMLNIPSTDIEGSVRQAKELEEAGCEIIRAAIPNKDAVKLIPALKEAVSVPIVADIHFDYKLALEACAAGIDKIRINPGNIGSDDRVNSVAFRLESVLTQVRLKRKFLQNTVIPHPRHFATAPCTMRHFLKNLISTILFFQ